jgi:hypothetical protein
MFSLSSHPSIYSLSKSLSKLSKCHYLVGKNIKLAKFTKMSLLGWQEYKVGQIYKFAIGPFLFWDFNY